MFVLVNLFKCEWVCTGIWIENTEHFMQVFIDQSKACGCLFEKACRIQFLQRGESKKMNVEF